MLLKNNVKLRHSTDNECNRKINEENIDFTCSFHSETIAWHKSIVCFLWSARNQKTCFMKLRLLKWTAPCANQNKEQSMFVLLEPWHRLLHVRELLAKWNRGEQEFCPVHHGSSFDSQLLEKVKTTPRASLREEARGSQVLHREFAQEEMQEEVLLGYPRPVHPRREVPQEYAWRRSHWKNMSWDDKLANEDHTHHITPEGISVPKQLADSLEQSWFRCDTSWALTWLQASIVNFATAQTPRRYSSSAKMAKLFLILVELAGILEAFFLSSPRKRTQHWLIRETCLKSDLGHLFEVWFSKLMYYIITVHNSVTANSSLLSLTGRCKRHTSNTAKSHVKCPRWKQSLRWKAMRTSVRRTAASPQTTTGTTRTTCSSQARHQWRRWHNALQRTRDVHALKLHAHFVPQLADTAHPWLKFWAHSHSIHGHPHGAISLTQLLPFLLPLLPVCLRLPLPPRTVPWARCSAAERLHLSHIFETLDPPLFDGKVTSPDHLDAIRPTGPVQRHGRVGHCSNPICQPRVPNSTTPVQWQVPCVFPEQCVNSSTRWHREDRQTLPSTRNLPVLRRTLTGRAKLSVGHSPMESSQTALCVRVFSPRTIGQTLLDWWECPAPSTLVRKLANLHLFSTLWRPASTFTALMSSSIPFSKTPHSSVPNLGYLNVGMGVEFFQDRVHLLHPPRSAAWVGSLARPLLPVRYGVELLPQIGWGTAAEATDERENLVPHPPFSTNLRTWLSSRSDHTPQLRQWRRLLHLRSAVFMGRRGWQAIEVPQGWFNVIRGPRPPSVRWPNARQQPDGVRSAAGPPVRPQQTSVQRWRQKVSPEVVMENARKQVSGLEAAIAAMIASGMPRIDDSQRVFGEGEAQRPRSPYCRAGERSPRICRSSSEAIRYSRQVAQRVGDRIGKGTGQVAAIEETSGGRSKVPASSAGASAGVGLRNPQVWGRKLPGSKPAPIDPSGILSKPPWASVPKQRNVELGW